MSKVATSKPATPEVTKADPKSVGIGASGLMYNKV
jgi:hypothetical protein